VTPPLQLQQLGTHGLRRPLRRRPRGLAGCNVAGGNVAGAGAVAVAFLGVPGEDNADDRLTRRQGGVLLAALSFSRLLHVADAAGVLPLLARLPHTLALQVHIETAVPAECEHG